MNNIDERSRDTSVLYSPQRTIEKVQALPHLVPVRLFEVLFPLWEVETTGIYHQEKPYELLEKYVTRGIAEGGLFTAQAISSFFGLDINLVEKILAFLETIGHITYTNRMLSLTSIGIKSVNEGKKIIARETHRKLYFDAFSLKPLSQSHYGRRIRILSEFDADQAVKKYSYRPLFSHQSWNEAAVGKLERRRDKADYNVPDEIHNLHALGAKRVYLPMHFVETRKAVAQSSPYYVVCTRLHDLRDTFFERIVNSCPDIFLSLQGEERMDVYTLWLEWLDRKGLSEVQPRQLSSGIWQVALTASAFQQQPAKLPLTTLGTYHLEKGYFLQIWSNDVSLRRKAAYDSTVKIVRRYRSVTLQDINESLQHFAAQLQVEHLTPRGLREWVEKIGDQEMLRLLDEIEEQV